jgi:hypothetical protein
MSYLKQDKEEELIFNHYLSNYNFIKNTTE